MNLPNIHGSNPSNSPPGGDPNARTKNQKSSLLSQYSSTLASQLSDNISPMNFVRQGTYNAFGNNVLTRSALGAVDSTGDFLNKMIGGEDEDLSTADKILKEQIKLLTKQADQLKENNDILKEILEVEKQKLDDGKEKKSNESDLEDMNNKKEDTEKIHPNKFSRSLVANGDLHKIESSSILETIAANVVDIKDILTKGFDNIHTIFDTDQKSFKRKKRGKLDDVSDANIISETRFSSQNHQKEEALLKKFQIDTLKFVKKIAIGVDKIYSIISASPIDQSEITDENSRSKRSDMHDVSDANIISETKNTDLPDIGSSGIIAAATAIVTGIIASMKSAREYIVKLFEEGFAKMKEFMSSAWESGKKLVKDSYEFVKEKGSSLLESAEDAAKKVSEKIFGKASAEGAAKTGAKQATKAIPFIGEAVMAGLSGFDAYKSYNDAENVLDIKGRKATTGEKIEAGAGGAVESLSFGLIDKKKTAKWLDDLVSTKEDKREQLNQAQKDLQKDLPEKATPAAAAAGAPSVSVNTTNNSYFSGKKNSKNEDSSFNRYLDKHYAF
jgi:hypothetical protein